MFFQHAVDVQVERSLIVCTHRFSLLQRFLLLELRHRCALVDDSFPLLHGWQVLVGFPRIRSVGGVDDLDTDDVLFIIGNRCVFRGNCLTLNFAA